MPAVWHAGNNLHRITAVERQQLIAERELQGTGKDDSELVVYRG